MASSRKHARIDAQGGGHDFRIAAVIFGSCQSKAVVKSIHLVGGDGVNFEPALRHNLDDGTVRHFNSNVDLIWTGSTAHGQQSSSHLGQPFAGSIVS